MTEAANLARRKRVQAILQLVPVGLMFVGLPIMVMGVGVWSQVGSTSPLPILGHVPEFELTERSGTTISTGDLRGQIWIADFIFTYCAGPCPRMTARMRGLQESFADLANVRLVTVTVDPERDTPEVLTQYADRNGAGKDRWLFLTGGVPDIRRIVVDGFKLGSIEDPILHSTRFVLVDGQGKIRGYYDSDTEEGIEQLVRDVRAGLRKPGRSP